MWWVPLSTALLLTTAVLALHYWHERRVADSARVYRARFVQLVAQLEGMTFTVNKLGHVVQEVHDDKLLDYYESTLRIMETLLAAIRRLKPFDRDPTLLDAALFLVKDCNQRVQRTKKAFRTSLKGKAIDFEALYGFQANETRGCYFCSRPGSRKRFVRVKVRLDGEVREVMSCQVCRSELEHTKKVKVLYFMKNGRPVHWSQVTDYSPSEDFWNINKREPVRKTRTLELVYSNRSDDS